MSRIPTIVRTLLGLGFILFGLNYFVPFLPAPKGMPAEAIAFVVPFIGAKYMGLVKAIEIVAGVMLVGNLFVPLALALLAPILVGITWFHIQLEPAGLPVPVALVALEIASAWFYREAFAPMLRAKVTPHAPNTASPARVTVRA